MTDAPKRRGPAPGYGAKGGVRKTVRVDQYTLDAVKAEADPPTITESDVMAAWLRAQAEQRERGTDMTTTSFEAAIERLHRVTFWVKGYRASMAGRLRTPRVIHRSGSPEAMLPGGAFAYLDIEDIEWLLKVAAAAEASADEARDEMGGTASERSAFRADFPATALLVSLFEDGDPT